MKLLNLDDIALNSERTVKFRGKSYAVKDFNVEEFIQFQKLFAEFRKYFNSEDTNDLDRLVETAQKITKIGVPTFDLEDVKLLNPMQLMALVSMVANLIPEPDAETEKVIEEKKD